MRIHLFAPISLVFVVLAQTGAGAQAPAKPAAPPAASAKAETRDTNLSAYMELLRSDVRAQKVAIITELMGFTAAEDTAFWPIYREYEVELAKLTDERLAAILEYANNYDKMTDAVADRLALKALDLESRRAAVKSKFYDRFKAKLSPRTVARFLQVENQLLLIIDLQIAASLPVLK
jgi:hypothetical protein